MPQFLFVEMKGRLVSLCVCFTAVIAFGQTEALEDSISSVMRKYDAVGLSVAVVKDTSIVYAHSFGYKDRECSTPLQIQDLFRIASVSKTFVATSVMQLVERGLLSLDDDVNKYLDFKIQHPQFPEIPITIRLLMSHFSGIHDSQGRNTFDRINPSKNPNFAKCYCDYAPGGGYTYCNMNYNLLGAVIEKISGERFDHYIQRHIMQPLHLHGSFNGLELDSSRFVNPYRYRKEADTLFLIRNAYQPTESNIRSYIMGYSTTVFSPAGGMIISIEELARYMMMHMYEGFLGSQIISRQSEKIIRQRPIQGNGGSMGIATYSNNRIIRGEVLLGRTGGAHGIHTAMIFHPQKKYGFIVFCNGCKSKSTDGHEMNFEIIKKLHRFVIIN